MDEHDFEQLQERVCGLRLIECVRQYAAAPTQVATLQRNDFFERQFALIDQRQELHRKCNLESASHGKALAAVHIKLASSLDVPHGDAHGAARVSRDVLDLGLQPREPVLRRGACRSQREQRDQADSR